MTNKTINGKQCTTDIDVDGNKIIHKNPIVVNAIIDLLRLYFGDLMVCRVNDHTFLGMNLRMREDKKIGI